MKWQDIPDWSFSVADSLLSNIRLKDPYTFQHCMRVGKQARKLAKAAGLNDYEQRLLEFIGLFHDVGKVGIPDQILLKPGRLEADEILIMKSHAEKSVDIIEPLTKDKFFSDMVSGIRFHHERYDGAGYPVGVKGDDIPLPARIIAVVDTVDAMLYARPYRKAFAWEKVQQELVDCSGSQFDPALVSIYLQAVRFFGQADFEPEKPSTVVQFVAKKSA